MIRVFLPSQLDDYTGGKRELSLELAPDADGTVALAAVIEAVDALYPGTGFRLVDEHGRIRRHIAMFVGETMVRTLEARVARGGRVQIVGALSGG
jgi:molybdopterin synthase sulfur carrier subunit